jgi:methylmalonyl-CoA/ethylmalonyl-CoA epimerase
LDNLSKALDELKRKGIKLIDSQPRELFGNRYAFVHHPNKLNGVLTELLEGDFDISRR